MVSLCRGCLCCWVCNRVILGLCWLWVMKKLCVVMLSVG